MANFRKSAHVKIGARMLDAGIGIRNTSLYQYSSSAHASGYSLVRKVISLANPDLEADFYGHNLAHVLMEPTRIYIKPLLALSGADPAD